MSENTALAIALPLVTLFLIVFLRWFWAAAGCEGFWDFLRDDE